VELVQLGLKGVSEKKFLKIATTAREITSHFQTRLIISANYKIAKDIKADGVHLEETDSCPTLVRKHLYTWQMIGGTAHTFQDCKILISKDIDYISLSPFRIMNTSTNLSQPLGLSGYTAIAEALNTETPIIGIGGITTIDVKAILKTGISGIAVSEAITQNFDVIREFHQLLNASATAEQRHTF
tara:strand:- start:364 stop:918 length:555 start_codon:yes stop_codon:yes gene_type:complete